MRATCGRTDDHLPRLHLFVDSSIDFAVQEAPYSTHDAAVWVARPQLQDKQEQQLLL